MNIIKPAKLKALEDALHSGLSVRAAARAAGVAKNTAFKYAGRRVYRCPCGRETGGAHKGWCAYRVARSASRRAFLRGRWGKACAGHTRLLRDAASGDLVERVEQAARSLAVKLGIRLATVPDGPRWFRARAQLAAIDSELDRRLRERT